MKHSRQHLALLCFVIVLFLLPAAVHAKPAPVALAPFKDTWVDPSPHKSGFITVNHVNLHYLDWGGKGKTLLFLAGMGTSVHIFDDIAPKFTDRFRVLGLTRRGQGQSEKPPTGYDVNTRVEDIYQFLKAMRVKKVILVGHSLAGQELTRFAGRHPDALEKLVYLDAAYDGVGSAKSFAHAPPPPYPAKEDLVSFHTVHDWCAKNVTPWTQAWEADLRATSTFSSTGAYLGEEMPGRASQGFHKSMEGFHADYSKVKVPALSFYALADADVMAHKYADPALQQQMQDFLAQWRRPDQRANIARFRREMRQGQVVILPNTDHYCFIQRQGEIVKDIRRFLLNSSAAGD